MLKSQVPVKESLLLRAVAAIAYIVCVLQWFWLLTLYLPLIREYELMEFFINNSEQPRDIIQTSPTEPSILMIVLAAVITIAIIGLTIYALVKTPGAIRNTGQKITHTAAKKYVVPAITHKKRLPQKKLHLMTLKVEFLIKLGFVIVPFAASLLAYLSPLPFEYRVVAVSSAALAATSFIFFTLEFVLKLGKRPSKLA
ncbi:MAG: hypothetical protein L0H36_03670 [bacterium]|nr:hypothetical protein [bacterium]